MFALTVAASAGARVAPTAGESTHLTPQAPVTGAPPRPHRSGVPDITLG